VALGISLLLSVPALRPVLRAISEISPLWIACAVALELASCVSFVIIFRLFFDRVGPRDARALAWTEMASGALLPGGGAGGYAIGGWLMHLTGAPTRWIVRRSSGLFLLTSAVNSAAVIGAGLLLLAGAAGPRHGWAVYLTDGRELARFNGPAAKRRALRYLASATKALRTPAVARKGDSPPTGATC
jgi:uncharacterized membrane protein YbhN (UPF0104 family)